MLFNGYIRDDYFLIPCFGSFHWSLRAKHSFQFIIENKLFWQIGNENIIDDYEMITLSILLAARFRQQFSVCNGKKVCLHLFCPFRPVRAGAEMMKQALSRKPLWAIFCHYLVFLLCYFSCPW